MPKFALYYVPQADDPFYQSGSQILGYDVRARQTIAPSSEQEKVIGRGNEAWTTTCRPYGFHLTICEALDCHWATIPRVEQEVANLLRCFNPNQPFLLQRKDGYPIGIWGEERSKSFVLLYEPNTSFLMLHTLLVARITPLGTGSDFLRRYLTHTQRELQPHQVQQIRLFSSPTVFENWYPHFTLLNPYPGEESMAIVSRLAQHFQSYRQITVQSICLLIQENDAANWQIYQEFHR